MKIIQIIASLGIFLGSVAWGMASLRVALQRMQQSSYRNERYLRRLFGADTTLFFRDSRHLLIGVAVLLALVLSFSSGIFHSLVAVLTIAFLVVMTRLTSASYKHEKKPFVFTQRAIRLAVLAVVTFLLPALFFFGSVLVWMPFWAALSPLLLVVVNMAIFPIEGQVNAYYLRDAAKRRRGMDELRVVGITGSYGKTSTKHFVHGILSRRFLSYMTPGSVNTDLGLAREVREHLLPVHEVFVAEMGARQKGDIEECCNVVQPTWGIVTCIGKAHLETFGSERAIEETKGELLQALPSDGLCFLSANDSHTPTMKSFAPCRVVTFGLASNGLKADVLARDITVTAQGSSFWIDGTQVSTPFEIQTRLLGRHNIANLVSAIAVALESGMATSVIQVAAQSLQPVEHRLQLLQKGDDILVIDDAFNSNPEGFREALDTLALFADRRRVLVTPGMVELGEAEEDENRTIGKYAAARVDHVVLVGNERRVSPLREGLLNNGFLEENIEVVSNLVHAQKHLRGFNRSGDIILFENDLPDLYG